MKELLNKIIAYQKLDYLEAKEVIKLINQNEFNDYQLVAIMTALQMREPEIEEMRGFQDALLDFAVPIDLSQYNGIDLCGTGGDGKNTFNISTISSLILASMGYPVVKHGNYGVSSICGSSNVLEFLGFKFTNNEDDLKKQLDNKNICFLHAPLFHPTLMKVGELRKKLGIRTFFNSLGPLVNPGKPAYQITGTYSLGLAKIYPFLLQDQRKNFTVLYGLDGYDEITLTKNTKLLGKNKDQIIDSSTFDKPVVMPNQIYGGDTIMEAGTILLDILKGKGTAEQNSVVAANVACAINCIQENKSLEVAFSLALEQIESGKAGLFFNY